MGRWIEIAAAVLLTHFVFCCAQSVDRTGGPGNEISVTGQAGLSTADSAPSSRPSYADDGFQGLGESTAMMAGGDPFVRSQPEQVPPFPLVLNRTVQSYVDGYLAQPEGLKDSFRRSQPYMPEMVSLLRNEGLPPDLIYLAFAESEFSSEGSGPWQLEPDTARQYGLVINQWIDERRDPIKSTRAAAEYLATLHDEARNDWRMTLVAWNNGDARLDHFMRLQDATYESLVSRLPRRTERLMNRFMAVALIARDAEKYGIERVRYNLTPQYHIVPVTGGTHLSLVAQEAHTSLSLLRTLNPAILQDRTPPGQETYPVRVPREPLRAEASLDEF
jgi:membrane-bound lytic murein transglycosylase D